MKKNYILLLLLCPFFFYGQITLNGTTVPDLSEYVGDNSENIPGTGEYQIFLDTQDGILDKPIILIDGFDPGNGRDIPGLYDLLSYEGMSGTENLADFVRTQGFDVVIFNSPVYTRPDMTVIDGGADFIERNAMLLVDLINIINNDKIGNEELVIIGPSMGGLISRYALNYMEDDGQDAETRLWMSFDAPHHGANVPIGLQHQLNYLAYGLGDGLNVVEIQPLIDSFLTSPAARQLLTDHFESHLADMSTVDFNPAILLPISHPWRDIFTTNINALTLSGFPETTRNVAIINGSGIGNPYFALGNSGTVTTPGFSVLDLDIPGIAPFTDAELEVNFTPTTAAGSSQVSRILVEFCFIGCSDIVNTTANAQAFGFTDGIDAAPGGLFDLSALTENITVEPGSLTETFLNALAIDKFNFIPSVSGLALEITNNEIDWYHDIDLGPGDPPSLSTQATTNDTPFVNWFLPDNNEPHVELTAANVAFALAEIIPETLGITEVLSSTFRLERNPVQNELVILSNQDFNNAHIKIIDLTGKVIYEDSNSLSNRTTIPLFISSGLYILNIEVENQLFQTKIIVN